MHSIWGNEKDGMDEYEGIKGYNVGSNEIEKETMRYLRVMWNSRQRYERWRDCGLERYMRMCEW